MFDEVHLNFRIQSGAKKRINLVDLVKSFQTNVYYYLVFTIVLFKIYYLLAKFGDTAENGPLRVCSKLLRLSSHTFFRKTQNDSDTMGGHAICHGTQD